VTETKFRKRKDPDPATTLEIQTRINCKGKAADQVLEEMGRALYDAETRDRDPLIVLEDLRLLRDSVATLIKGVCRLLVGYPRAVSLWESSGYTEAFLNVMEWQDPSTH